MAQLKSKLVEALGLRNRRPSGFFSTQRQLNRSARPLPHINIVRRAWESFGLGAVLYVDRHPAAYFKEVDVIDPVEVRELQRRLWNHGVTPLLVLAGPREVHVYSGRALPARNDESPSGGNRLVTTLNRASDALELQQLVAAIETGQIYAEHPHCFDRDQAVDRYLLRNLAALRSRLTSGKGALDSRTTRALLTRLIFTCYLIEREIVKGNHFPGSELDQLSATGGLRQLLGVCRRTPAHRQNALRHIL